MDSFYSVDELQGMGFQRIGRNIQISRKTSIYSPNRISLGDNVRIDDFCILSGKIMFGNNIHIAAGCFMFAGNAGIEFGDFSGLSSRCTVYAVSDDYSGEFLTNPMVPSSFRNVVEATVILEKHVIVGAGSTILPGVRIAAGCSVGSMSLVARSTEEWGIYVGIPCKRLKSRSQNVLKLEAEYLGDLRSNEEV